MIPGIMLNVTAMALWATATLLGSGSIIFLCASFRRPEFAGLFLTNFGIAVFLLYASRKTKEQLG